MRIAVGGNVGLMVVALARGEYMNKKDMMILSIDTPMDGNDEIICLYSLEHKGFSRSRMGAQG